MAGAVLNLTEARRELPRLLREVSAGSRTVRIGLRGKATAVLVSADEYDELRCRAAAPAATERGWAALRFEVVGTRSALDAELRQVRRDLNASLERRIRRYSPDRTRRRK